MTRMYKTAKEYRQKLFDLEKETTLLRNILIERATKLCQLMPDVIVLGNVQAINYIEMLPYSNNHYIIGIIETLEKELGKQEPFIQTEIKFN